MSLLIRTSRDSGGIANSNAARVRWSGGEKALKGGHEFEINEKRVYVIRLNPRSKVTIENTGSRMWSTEMSVGDGTMLDDVLKAGKSISLKAYASIELRR